MRNNLLVIAVVLAVYVVAAPTTATLVDINDPYIQNLGKWAVAEHVKQANDGIKFNKVVSGDKGPAWVVGISYDLIIDASNRDGKDTKYKAVITKSDWGRKPVLKSFKPTK